MDDRTKKRKQRKRHHHLVGYPESDSSTTLSPSYLDVKRKLENEGVLHCPPKSRKYGANDGSNKYHKPVNQRKHQKAKVPKGLCYNKMKQPHLHSSRDASVTTTSSLFGLPSDHPKPHLDLAPIDLYPRKHFGRQRSQSVIYEPHFDDTEHWNSLGGEKLSTDMQKLRSKCWNPYTSVFQPSPVHLNFVPENPGFGVPATSDNPLYIVVDTNIFISHLGLLRDIAKLHWTSKAKPIIYIPWMVLKELDFFKDNRTGSSITQSAAKRAVSFINEMLTKKDEALKGQTLHESLMPDYSNPSAVDNVLYCCLRLQQNRSRIILLSNDQNLRSKVMVHSIEACSTNAIVNILNRVEKPIGVPVRMVNNTNDQEDVSAPDSPDVASAPSQQQKPKEQTPTEKIEGIFTVACTEIVRSELEKAYGDTAYKMITKPPWSLEECLSYIKRFWVPVFSIIMIQRQCLKTVDDLLHFVKTHKGFVSEPSGGNAGEFIKLILSLCFHLKNCLSPYEPILRTCISDIQNVFA